MLLEMVSRESGLPLEFYKRWPDLGETDSSICYSIYSAQIQFLTEEDRAFLETQKPLILDYQTYEYSVARR